MALLSSAATLAAEFKCGKTFITFPTREGSYGGEKTIGGIVTIPKEDIRMLGTLDVPNSSPVIVAFKRPKGKALSARAIDEDTRRRIVKCLD